MSTKKIHINQHKIKANKKHNTADPVITVKTYKDNVYGSDVCILDDNGKTIARIVYRPNHPLSCGATVWIETQAQVKVATIDREVVLS